MAQSIRFPVSKLCARGVLQRLLEHAEMLGDQRLIVAHFVDAAGEHDAAGVEHDARRRRERARASRSARPARSTGPPLSDARWCGRLRRRSAAPGPPRARPSAARADCPSARARWRASAARRPRASRRAAAAARASGGKSSSTRSSVQCAAPLAARLPRHDQILAHRQRREDAPPLRHEAHALARDRFGRESRRSIRRTVGSRRRAAEGSR